MDEFSKELKECAAGLRDGMGGHTDYCARLMEEAADRINRMKSDYTAQSLALKAAKDMQQVESVEFQHEHRVVLKIMAALATLLDEDQFAHIEQIARRAGVNPPSNAFLFGGRVKISPYPEHGRLFAELMDGDCVAACVYGSNRNELFQRIAALNVSQLPAVHERADANGWIRAIDEDMVCAHIGIADGSEDYATAKKKLNDLIAWHVAVATNPAVNGGYKLVPIEPTEAMLDAAVEAAINWSDGFPNHADGYRAMISATNHATIQPLSTKE